MPDRFAAVEASIEAQRALIADLSDLPKFKRRQKIYNWLLGAALALIAVGGFSIYGLVIQNRNDRIEGCRSQNGAQEAARADIATMLDSVVAVNPEATDFINGLRANLSRAEIVDEDCNRNGRVDSGDYNPRRDNVSQDVLDRNR